MMGLLIKDWKIILTQKNVIFIVLGICFVFLIKGQNVENVVIYATAMLSLLVTSTINYDEVDNGMGFLFTLPISRKKYLLEKYTFSFLIAGSTSVLGNLAAMAISIAKSAPYSFQAFLTGLVSSLAVAILMVAILIPVQLKFGSEKGRIVLFMISGCVLAIGYLCKKAAEIFSVDLLGWLQGLGQTEVLVYIGVSLAAALGISYQISVAAMQKKQF